MKINLTIKKIKLETIEIQSFVTDENLISSQTLKGGTSSRGFYIKTLNMNCVRKTKQCE